MDLFTKIAVVTLLAATLVWTLQKFRQSAVVAYLALGLVVGPGGFGLLPHGHLVEQFAEIGVVLLLFFIGLEFHLGALKEMLRFAMLGTLVQMLLTAGVVGGGAWALGLRGTESLILGLAAALSSTAIVMKSFDERRESDSATAHATLALLLGQDIAALLIVAALPLFVPAAGASNSLNPAASFGIMLVALPAIFLVARRLLPWVFRKLAVSRNQEAFALCSLGACLAVAVLAQRAGASLALGAFLGGLVFADSPYAHQIRADLKMLKNLALGFFFITVGMLTDPAYVVDHAALLASSLVFIVIAKLVLGALAFRIFRYPWSIAAGGGLALSQIGEFAFVLAGATQKAGALSQDAHQLLIAVAILTMLVAPALVSRSRQFGQWIARRLGDRTEADHSVASAATDDPGEGVERVKTPTRAIVVGYGPVGRTLCKILIRFGVRPCVVDLKLKTIQRLKEMGRDAIFGDAGQREILVAAGVTEARYLIITLPDFASRAPIITSARAINPAIMILSRARYLDERRPLEQAGATHVSYEECEVAAELARLLLSELHVRKDLLDHEVARLRTEIAVRSGFTVVVQRPADAPPGATAMHRIKPVDDQADEPAPE